MSMITEIIQLKDTNSIATPKTPSYWTDAKIKKIALYVMASLLLFAAGASIAASVIGLFPSTFALISIPLFLGALGLGHISYQIKDYQNPEKLKKYREDAIDMNFQELFDAHGVQNIIAHQILSKEDLKKKFILKVQEMNFDAVLKHFKWNDLTGHGVTSTEHIQFLQDLTRQAEEMLTKCRAHLRQIDLQYANRSDKLRATVHQAKLLSDALVIETAKNGKKTTTFSKGNMLNGPLPFAEDAMISNIQKDQQIRYEQKSTQARRECIEGMNRLQSQYTEFTNGL